MKPPARPDETIRVLILADERGNILGAFGNLSLEGESPPVQVEIVPSEGQIVREVEVPIDMLDPDSQDDVFSGLRLEFDDEGGRLVER
jgi:hypothetical protein